MTQEEFKGWISAGKATDILRRNHPGRSINRNYVSKLGAMGVITTRTLSTRFCLYKESDVEAYRVEDPGAKAGRNFAEKAKAKRVK